MHMRCALSSFCLNCDILIFRVGKKLLLLPSHPVKSNNNSKKAGNSLLLFLLMKHFKLKNWHNVWGKMWMKTIQECVQMWVSMYHMLLCIICNNYLISLLRVSMCLTSLLHTYHCNISTFLSMHFHHFIRTYQLQAAVCLVVCEANILISISL